MEQTPSLMLEKARLCVGFCLLEYVLLGNPHTFEQYLTTPLQPASQKCQHEKGGFDKVKYKILLLRKNYESWTFIELRFWNDFFDLVLFRSTPSALLDRSLIFSQTEYLKSIYGSKLINTGQRTKELFCKMVALIIHLTFKRIFPKWLQIANWCCVYHNCPGT